MLSCGDVCFAIQCNLYLEIYSWIKPKRDTFFGKLRNSIFMWCSAVVLSFGLYIIKPYSNHYQQPEKRLVSFSILLSVVFVPVKGKMLFEQHILLVVAKSQVVLTARDIMTKHLRFQMKWYKLTTVATYLLKTIATNFQRRTDNMTIWYVHKH